MSKRSFLIHVDSLSILDKLNDEQAGKLFKAIGAHNAGTTIPDLDFSIQIALEPFINQFARDKEKYARRCEINTNNANMRWDANNANRINRMRTMRKDAKHADSDNDNENDGDYENVNVNGNAKGATKSKVYVKRFIEPTQDEVSAYASEIGKHGLVDGFVDYYTSKGWVVGKSPMKDWKAAVRNWCKDKQPIKTKSQSADNDGYYQSRALPTPQWIVDLAKKKEV